MTEATKLEASLERLLAEGEVDMPGYALAAVALSLARALRSHGAEVEDRGWHIRECVLAVDWSHYQIESPCSCEIERSAVASFIKAMLGGDDA